MEVSNIAISDNDLRNQQTSKWLSSKLDSDTKETKLNQMPDENETPPPPPPPASFEEERSSEINERLVDEENDENTHPHKTKSLPKESYTDPVAILRHMS